MQLESQAKNFSFKLSESLIKNAARKETFTNLSFRLYILHPQHVHNLPLFQ